MIPGKTMLDLVIYFLLTTVKRMAKQYISALKANMASLEFRLKPIDQTRNYLLEELKGGELMSERRKKVCKGLNYFEHIIFASALSGCFNFCTSFITWHLYRYYKFYNRIKN